MKADAYQPLLHRFAVLTVCVALLPIVVGAVVTTKGAGMAFADWPSSDGHNMFFYPWLQSAGAKFIEHGHRLAGVLIGIVSIALVVIAWKKERRQWVRVTALCVLLGVIAQGILGGIRVRMDDPVLAMLHGSFAALVFALMAGVSLWTSRSWFQMADREQSRKVRHLKPLAVMTAAIIFGQYLVGGSLRHLGTSLHEHIALAVLVLIIVSATSVVSLLSLATWLRKPACWLLAIVVLQIVLGGGAFATKFGFPPSGLVAVEDSMPQVAFRTAHTVVGMLLFMISVLLTVRVFRLDFLHRLTVGTKTEQRPVSGGSVANGGRE